MSFVSEVNTITWFSSHLCFSLGNNSHSSFQESSKGLISGFFTYCYFYFLSFFLLKHHSTWPTCRVARRCKPLIVLKTGFSHSNIKLFLTANYSTAPESNIIDSIALTTICQPFSLDYLTRKQKTCPILCLSFIYLFNEYLLAIYQHYIGRHGARCWLDEQDGCALTW